MAHHNGDFDCPACLEKLKTAHVVLQDWYRTRVKIKFPNAHVSWSYRGKEDQETAFGEGKSKLHYPNSAHNCVNETGLPESKALDLFQIDDDHQALFNPRFYFAVAEMNKSEGAPVLWGGDFPTFKDYDHFEMIENDPEKAA